MNYLSYTLKVHDILSTLRNIIDELGGGERARQWRDTVSEMDAKLESMRFQVAVVGEFKRGKTSFINALLRREILPADVAPATATINRVTYGNVPSAFIRWKDGRPDEKVEIDSLSRYITKLTVESAGNAERIREAVVCYPCLFCENNVDLIDTPGMNDDDDMNALTIGELSKIDLAIVTLDPKYPISFTESNFIAKLVESDQICQIIFVASKMDTIPTHQRQKVLETVSKRLATQPREALLKNHREGDEVLRKCDRLLSHPVIYPISAVKALEAYGIGSQELLEESGFQRLTDELAPLIITTQHSAAILTPISMTVTICRKISQLCRNTVMGETASERRKELRQSFAGTAYGSWTDSASIMHECQQTLEKLRKDRVQEVYGKIRSAFNAGGRAAGYNAAVWELQRLATELPREEESGYRFIWERRFLYSYGLLSQALRRILESSADMLSGQPPDLKPLTCAYDKLPIRYGEQVLFGWSSDPVPPDGTPPGRVDYLILSGLEAAFSSYYDKRIRRAAEMIDRMTAYESETCQRIVREYFKATPPVAAGESFEGLDKGRAKLIDRAAAELTEVCAKVRDSYLAELDGTK